VALQTNFSFQLMLLGFDDKVRHGCPFPPLSPVILDSMCLCTSLNLDRFCIEVAAATVEHHLVFETS
jgi:hypothetical protein